MPDASGHARLTCQNRVCSAMFPRDAETRVLPSRKPGNMGRDANPPDAPDFIFNCQRAVPRCLGLIIKPYFTINVKSV